MTRNTAEIERIRAHLYTHVHAYMYVTLLENRNSNTACTNKHLTSILALCYVLVSQAQWVDWLCRQGLQVAEQLPPGSVVVLHVE